MTSRRSVMDIIDDIIRLQDQDPKDGLSTPFIVDKAPRDSSYYSRLSNEPGEPIWEEQILEYNQPGPPKLVPVGQEWVDQESGELMAGLSGWPPVSNLVGLFDMDGIDVLAWYRSFHYEPISSWGIYILDKGIYYLAKELEQQFDPSEITPKTRQKCIDDATNILYFHEMFHFYTDLAAANLEISEYRSMYVDYSRDRYGDGWTVNDGAKSPIPAKLEEALANEFMRSKTMRKETEKFRKALFDFMSKQPDGYRHWEAVKHNQLWKEALSKLGERLLNNENRLPEYLNVNSVEKAIDRIYERQVPVYLVNTIPDDIYRFAPLKKFEEITISDQASRLMKKLKNPKLVKKINSRLNRLIGNEFRYDNNLRPLKRKGWWKYNLGQSGDSHGNPRMILSETDGSKWVLEWVGKHSDYDKWRAIQGI